MEPYVQAGRTEVDALVMVQIHQLNVYAIVMIISFILIISEGILEQVLLIPEADGLGPIWAVVCIIPATIVSFGMVMTILRSIKWATALPNSRVRHQIQDFIDFPPSASMKSTT